jgi:hypothetical protein
MYLQPICFTLKGRLRRYFAHPVFAHQKNISDPLTDAMKSFRILTESTPPFYFEGNPLYEKDSAESSLNSNNWGEIAAIVGRGIIERKSRVSVSLRNWFLTLQESSEKSIKICIQMSQMQYIYICVYTYIYVVINQSWVLQKPEKLSPNNVTT